MGNPELSHTRKDHRMRSIRPVRTWLAMAGIALAIACSSDGTDPDEPGTERPPEALNLLRLRADAPPLEQDSVSFWAFRGESVETKLYFLNDVGERGNEYLSLKLEDETLDRYPDGTSFADGDSVLITIKVVDPALILFDLEPTGLQFSPAAPAELRIKYAEADDDFDDDGDDDEDDDEIEFRLGIWRQENPGDPFVRLGTLRGDDDDLEADLTGFSRYAIAY
jgi:hypothetical protein